MTVKLLTSGSFSRELCMDPHFPTGLHAVQVIVQWEFQS